MSFLGDALKEVDALTPGSEPVAVVKVPPNWRSVAKAAGMTPEQYLKAMEKLAHQDEGIDP